MKTIKQRHLQKSVSKYLTAEEQREMEKFARRAARYVTGARKGELLAQAKGVLKNAKQGKGK